MLLGARLSTPFERAAARFECLPACRAEVQRAEAGPIRIAGIRTLDSNVCLPRRNSKSEGGSPSNPFEQPAFEQVCSNSL